MGAIGNAINSAVDAVSGSSSGTTLQNFLSKFSSSEGKWVDRLDPLATFDVTFKFYPTLGSAEGGGDALDKLGASLVSSAKGAVKNLANNLTGGLLGSIMNDIDIKGNHDSFSDAGNCTFLEYLASSNLIVGKEDWVGESAGQSVCPLELALGLYVQKITIPNLKIPDGSKSQTLLGDFPVNGTAVIPDNNLLTMSILNTHVPLHERIFYPWMREVTLPFWSYNVQPYTTATITIDLTKHSDIKYVFCGCRPQQVQMQQPTQEPDGIMTRDVSFWFDFMFVTSSLKTTENWKDKLLSTGKTLFNSAAKMVNL